MHIGTPVTNGRRNSKLLVEKWVTSIGGLRYFQKKHLKTLAVNKRSAMKKTRLFCSSINFMVIVQGIHCFILER